MGRSQRIKGRAFEQKIARVLRPLWPEVARGIQTRFGGKESSDLINIPFHPECSKGGESIWAKWKQANEDAAHNGMAPVVIKQRDRESPVTMMSLKFALELWWAKYGPDMPIDTLLEEYKKEFGTL